jgi:XTP/dITP diphosphohydrolase
LKLLVATTNEGKLRELEAILEGLPVRTVRLGAFPEAPEVAEDGETFAENAAKKALAYARFSGLLTVAEDSGLCVEALGGRPGVLSARYAGGDRRPQALCGRLLEELAEVPASERGAAFHCVVALARPEGVVFTVEGRCEGRITTAMRGSGGFGYDPVFLYEPLGRTFAELSPEEKNEVSHRARALRAFREKFEATMGAEPGGA